MTPSHTLHLFTLSPNSCLGRLVIDGRRRVPCALGRSGLSWDKREGDGATPIGIFSPLYAFYRADRLFRPKTFLPLFPLTPSLGWCDDSQDRAYNRKVTLPYPGRSETLWRHDGLYDVVVVLSHNQCPIKKGRGSAIFLHIARPQRRPTEGCLAFALRDLLKIIETLSPQTSLHIGIS